MGRINSITTKHILLLLGFSFVVAVLLNLLISKKLSNVITTEARAREVEILFSAIEAGPLAMARLQASAIAQEQLMRLMTNPQLKNRGFVTAEVSGGPNLSYVYGKWESTDKAEGTCLKEFSKDFNLENALNPFKVTLTLNECQVLAEQSQIYLYSIFASILIMLLTICFIVFAIWPILTSVRSAEIAFQTRFQKINSILYSPIRSLVREAVRSFELEQEQSLTTIAQQVSHDIRSPLSTINVAVNTMEHSPAESMKLIRMASERINAIADQLLSARKSLLAGEINIFKNFIERLVVEKRAELANKPEIQLSLALDIDPLLKFKFNQVQLSQIISNLINNSVEALLGRGNIIIKVTSKPKSILISVTDNGPGISNEVLRQIELGAKSIGKNGTGIGLSSARRSLEIIGGQLKVESASMKGTTVTIILPT